MQHDLLIGASAALTAAFLWAIATWIFSHMTLSFGALALNVVKGVIASLLLAATVGVTGDMALPTTQIAWWILLISGVLGIAVGDSAYFAALKRLGPRRTLILESIAPPLTGVIALVALGVAMQLTQWLAIGVTICGVMWVVSEKANVTPENRQFHLPGVSFGLLAAFCQASGIVMSHFALTEADISPLWAALIRLCAGTAVVTLMLTVKGQIGGAVLSPLGKLSRPNAVRLLLAIITGTYLAIWLSQVAIKYANPAIAQTLLSTSPLFALPIAMFMGERLSTRAVVGTLIAVGGVSWLVSG